MRIVSTLCLAAALFAPAAVAQNQDQIPVRQAQLSSPGQLRVDEKLRRICDQLDLDERQKLHVEGLFQALMDEAGMSGEELQNRLLEIRAKIQDRDAATRAGDMQLVSELNEQIRNLAPTKSAETNFIAGLLPALNDAQKEKFNRLLKQMDQATGEVSMTPIDVVRLAHKSRLSKDQQRQLDEILRDFRSDIARAPQDQLTQRLFQLVQKIDAILNDAQRQPFRAEIDRELPGALTATTN